MIHPKDENPEKPIPVTEQDRAQDRELGVEPGQPNWNGEEIRFNLYAMTLSELTQEELSQLDEEEIRSALEEGKEEVGSRNASDPAAVRAYESVRGALKRLRG